MTAIRNLPLAARLGGAFGVLVLAMAVMAFTSINAMSGLRAKSDDLAEHQLRAADLLGGMQTRAKDNINLIAQHLYVHDGDLAEQDRVAADMAANFAASKKAGAELEQLFEGTPAESAYAGYDAKRADFVKLQQDIVKASRAETVAH